VSFITQLRLGYFCFFTGVGSWLAQYIRHHLLVALFVAFYFRTLPKKGGFDRVWRYRDL